MRKQIGLIVAMLCIALFPASVLASTSVGFVDVGRVMEQSPQAQALSQQLQREFEPAQSEMREMQSRMQTLQNRMERDAEVMSAEDRREIEREIRDIQRGLQRRQSDLAEDFNTRRNEALGRLQRLIMAEVQAYARDNGLDLVVGEGVFYASSQVDITDAILDRLRQRHQREQD
ncbi:OmpH family outer membrane protein [Natronospira bacteriovora]|uniref:OmpH family outer membrane protein n=1 Tax=Natronospira bacteriovora TaxID=3069753 RepID=A0ABU0W2U5_9GAMM|nr:OmpH family outer membrane protein [Natronospira sp. AB-CW4]MDQ2068336.1 OmpH family outer membrane protein [Natronospira sp. AB-CW4]